MELLPDALRSRLPPINAQEAEVDPWVYCRYFLRDTECEWYVIEGQPDEDDFLFYGFVREPGDFNFRQFRLSELTAFPAALGVVVELDSTFVEGRLTDVVPAPDC